MKENPQKPRKLILAKVNPIKVMAVKNIFFRNLKLKKDLAEWGVANNSTRRMLDDLLKILIDYGLDLPKNSRTLKGTPRDINTSAKCMENSFI